MPGVEQGSSGRGRTAGTGRESVAVPTDRPRPQWRGLFVEPDLPPRDEEDGDE